VIQDINHLKDQQLDSLQHTIQQTIDDLKQEFPEFMTPQLQEQFSEALTSEDASKYEELTHTLQSQLE
jgi:hypothetical protein